MARLAEVHRPDGRRGSSEADPEVGESAFHSTSGAELEVGESAFHSTSGAELEGAAVEHRYRAQARAEGPLTLRAPLVPPEPREPREPMLVRVRERAQPVGSPPRVPAADGVLLGRSMSPIAEVAVEDSEEVAEGAPTTERSEMHRCLADRSQSMPGSTIPRPRSPLAGRRQPPAAREQAPEVRAPSVPRVESRLQLLVQLPSWRPFSSPASVPPAARRARALRARHDVGPGRPGPRPGSRSDSWRQFRARRTRRGPPCWSSPTLVLVRKPGCSWASAFLVSVGLDARSRLVTDERR